MRRLTAAVLVAGLVAATGCAREASAPDATPEASASRSSSEAAAQERIAQAASTTQGEQSARFTMAIVGRGAGGDVDVTAEGGVDFVNQRSRITLDLGEEMGARSGGRTMAAIKEGSIVYLRVPNAEMMRIPTPWLKVDTATERMPGMPNLEQFASGPVASIAMLEAVTDDVVEVGSEDIRGATTTHYRATLDANRAAEDLPAAERAVLQHRIELVGTALWPVDIWIDVEGRLRRHRMQVEIPGTEGVPSTTTTTTFELFDFGAPVDVEPPPRSQVTDWDDSAWDEAASGS